MGATTPALVSDHLFERPGMEGPRVFLGAVDQPVGPRVLYRRQAPGVEGSPFVGALSGLQVQRLTFNQPGQAGAAAVLTESTCASATSSRARTATSTYDEVRYGSGKPDGTIIRLNLRSSAALRRTAIAVWTPSTSWMK
jgi:hypothetical protein